MWKLISEGMTACESAHTAPVIMRRETVLCNCSAAVNSAPKDSSTVYQWLLSAAVQAPSPVCAVCCRWCVAVAAEPCDMERQLLERLDYAANVVLNGQRRVSLLC